MGENQMKAPPGFQNRGAFCEKKNDCILTQKQWENIQKQCSVFIE
jgi:hypothetical protein